MVSLAHCAKFKTGPAGARPDLGQFRRDLVPLELIGGVLDGRLHSAEIVAWNRAPASVPLVRQ
jgi:hypothetical protein